MFFHKFHFCEHFNVSYILFFSGFQIDFKFHIHILFIRRRRSSTVFRCTGVMFRSLEYVNEESTSSEEKEEEESCYEESE